MSHGRGSNMIYAVLRLMGMVPKRITGTYIGTCEQCQATHKQCTFMPAELQLFPIPFCYQPFK